MKDPKDIKILVVDDEEVLRDAIVFDFKRKGFDVLSAKNGVEAFEIVKNEKIDLVLTDVRMPGGDGIELLDNIKASNPNLPVVMFITGFADITLEEAYDKGVDVVFAKPFDRKALLAAVMRSLSGPDEKWGARQFSRIDSDFEIVLNFPDLNRAVQGKVLNISRGGMFISLKDNFPNVEARANFNIKFNMGNFQSLEGEGIVRWIRTEEQGGLPAGCGIEFTYLSEQSRSQFVHFLNDAQVKAFIPKS